MNCCTTALYPCFTCWTARSYERTKPRRLWAERGYASPLPDSHPRNARGARRWDDNLDGYTHLEERSHNG